MDIRKAFRRDSKINKRQNGMRVVNKSIFTIQEEEKKRSLQIKKEREEKERSISSMPDWL